MSIRVVCPNGHPLRVADNLAGRVGLCPVCKGQVKVPRPGNAEQFSEDAILGLLKPGEPAPNNHGLVSHPSVSALVDASASPPPSAMKTCEHCNREIAAKIHVCPFCHTYIASLSDA